MKRHISFGAVLDGVLLLLVGITGVYLVHWLSGGLVLASGLLTVAVLVVMLGLLVWGKMRFKVKAEELAGQGEALLPLAIMILALGAYGYYWAGAASVTGDYAQHHYFATQLRYGFARTHRYYVGAPSFYPPLTHASIAALANVAGLTVHRAQVLLGLLLTCMMPFVAYRLGRVVGFGRLAATFLAGSISLTGGYYWAIRPLRILWLYLPGMQLSLHFISRSLGIVLLMFFLVLLMDVLRGGKVRSASLARLGLLVGLLGVTHPSPFVLAAGMLGGLLVFLRLRRGTELRTLLAAIPGSLLALLYCGPLLATVARYHGFGGFARNTPEIVPGIPQALALYGPLLVMAAIALIAGLSERERDAGFVVPALALTAYFGIFGLVGLAPGIKRLMPVLFKTHRYGPLAFIFLALMAARAVQLTQHRFRPEAKARTRRLLFAGALGLLLLAGFAPMALSLGRARARKGRPRNPCPEIRAGRWALLPAGEEDYLRLISALPSLPTAIMLPPDMATGEMAHFTGLDVVYTERPRIQFKRFFTAGKPQPERLRMVEEFYRDLDAGVVRLDLLRQARATLFFARQSGLADQPMLQLVAPFRDGYVYRDAGS